MKQQHLWLIWRDPKNRLRYKVGVLSFDGESYYFEYTNPELDDATAVGFEYYPGFDRGTKYKSPSLFTNIKDRLPNPERSDYLDTMNEYDLPSDASDWDVLVATKGRLVTDDYEFVQPFTLDKIEFDVAGTKYRKDFDKFKDILSLNSKVYLVREPTNLYDNNAVEVCFRDISGEEYQLGYVPRFYSEYLTKFLASGQKYSAMIKRIQLGGDTHDNDITAEVQLVFAK